MIFNKQLLRLFLLEAKDDILIAMKKKLSDNVDDDVIEYFFENDPTSDKKYFKYLIDNYKTSKNVIKTLTNTSVPEYMIQKIKFYNSNKKFLPPDISDFRRFSFVDLCAKINDFQKHESDDPDVEEGKKLIFENSKYELYRITNVAASCHFGKGTKWCISKHENKHFEEYQNDNKVIFFLIFKNKFFTDDEKKRLNYKHAIVISTKEDLPDYLKGAISEWRNPNQTKKYSDSEIPQSDKEEIIKAIEESGIEVKLGKSVSKTNELECYYENGVLSRDDGPSITSYRPDGTVRYKMWSKQGVLENGNLPSMIQYHDNGEIWFQQWNKNGKPYVPDGHSISRYYPDKSIQAEQWGKNGKLHNDHGPAQIFYKKDGSLLDKKWFVDGKELSYDNYKKWQIENGIVTESWRLKKMKKHLKESDVTDKRGNIVISPGLKVKHKESQFEYTVDNVVQEPNGKITIVLSKPEAPRFDSKDNKKVMSDLGTAQKKVRSNVLYEAEPVDDIKSVYYEPDPGDEQDDDKIAISVEEFEKEYEVK